MRHTNLALQRATSKSYLFFQIVGFTCFDKKYLGADGPLILALDFVSFDFSMFFLYYLLLFSRILISIMMGFPKMYKAEGLDFSLPVYLSQTYCRA